jgi:hypothetical protein
MERVRVCVYACSHPALGSVGTGRGRAAAGGRSDRRALLPGNALCGPGGERQDANAHRVRPNAACRAPQRAERRHGGARRARHGWRGRAVWTRWQGPASGSVGLDPRGLKLRSLLNIINK